MTPSIANWAPIAGQHQRWFTTELSLLAFIGAAQSMLSGQALAPFNCEYSMGEDHV